MGVWQLRKPEPSHIQGICVTCQSNKQRKSGTTFKPQCSSCNKKRFGRGARRSYPSKDQRFKQSVKAAECGKCGFVPEHPCQLDVDHIDGDKHNNEPSNLMTLCANCHRLKTHLSRDYDTYYSQETSDA